MVITNAWTKTSQPPWLGRVNKLIVFTLGHCSVLAALVPGLLTNTFSLSLHALFFFQFGNEDAQHVRMLYQSWLLMKIKDLCGWNGWPPGPFLLVNTPGTVLDPVSKMYYKNVLPKRTEAMREKRLEFTLNFDCVKEIRLGILIILHRQ